MNQKQVEDIKKLYLVDKHALGRTLLRLKPCVDRFENVESLEQISKLCRLNTDVFLSVHSNDEINSKEYCKIFIDIDDEFARRAYMKMISVCHKLKKNDIENYSIFLSGSKGYHIYIRFNTLHLSNYREAVKSWMKDIGILDLVDTRTVDIKRVSRIPHSVNSKGRRCIPLGNNERDIKIDTYEIKDWKFEINESFHKILKKYDKAEKKSNLKVIQGGIKSSVFTKREEYPECMGLLVDDAIQGVHLGHTERVEMGKFLLHVYGGDVDKVNEYYMKLGDYSEQKTKYQLNYLKAKKLRMMNCHHMQINSLCPVKEQCECPFNPSINSYMT